MMMVSLGKKAVTFTCLAFVVVVSFISTINDNDCVVVDALTTNANAKKARRIDATNSSNKFIRRREALLRIPVAIGVGSAAVEVSTTAAIAATVGAEIIEEEASKLLPQTKKNTGVLWRTIRGQAAPATPGVLNKLVHAELFGGSCDNNNKSNSKTTGIVCISERHDDFEHHVVQLHIIQSIRKALDERHPVRVGVGQQPVETADGGGPRSQRYTAAARTTSSKTFAIGMECFQRKDQPYLDKFVNSGSMLSSQSSSSSSLVASNVLPQSVLPNVQRTTTTAYTLNDLKRDVDWDTNWGYDILHYAPILNQAQKYKLRILGLHPSQELVDQVYEFGLAGLPDSVIAGVNTNSKLHWERFKKTTQEQMENNTWDLSRIGTSLCDGGSASAMDSFIQRSYEVQCFREEYMADTVAQHMGAQQLDNNPGWVAILAGERHIVGRDGIPNRALRRMSARLAQHGTLGTTTAAAATAASAKWKKWNSNHTLMTKKKKKKNTTTKNDDTTSASVSTAAVSNRGVFTFVPRSVSFPVALATEAHDQIHKSADYIWFTQRDPNATFDAAIVNLAPTRGMIRQQDVGLLGGGVGPGLG